MERLSDTVIEIVNELHTERLDYDNEYLPLMDAFDRLAAYEDTGLEPEEVAYFLGTTMSVKEAKTQYAEHKKRYDEWFAWKQAEQEGRLLVPPCTVGDTVCCLNPFDEIENGKITMIQQKADGTWKFRVTTSFSHDVTIDAIGKTVFLTREAAEAKLKERENDG